MYYLLVGNYYSCFFPGIGRTDMDGFLRHVGLAWFDKLGQNIRQKAAMDNANGLGHTWSFNELSVNIVFNWCGYRHHCIPSFKGNLQSCNWFSSCGWGCPLPTCAQDLRMKHWRTIPAVACKIGGWFLLYGVLMGLTGVLPHWQSWKWKNYQTPQVSKRGTPTVRCVLNRTIYGSRPFGETKLILLSCVTVYILLFVAQYAHCSSSSTRPVLAGQNPHLWWLGYPASFVRTHASPSCWHGHADGSSQISLSG